MKSVCLSEYNTKQQSEKNQALKKERDELQKKVEDISVESKKNKERIAAEYEQKLDHANSRIKFQNDLKQFWFQIPNES